MRGKVKNIKRSEWYVGNLAYQHSHDLHDNRLTCLYAETYDGHQVLIDEADVLRYFERQRFSENLIAELNTHFRGKLIEYEKNADGDFYLKGSIINYY